MTVFALTVSSKYILLRPDPQVIWDTPKTNKNWKKLNGHYHKSKKGGGEWEFFELPQEWTINYSLPINKERTSVSDTHLATMIRPATIAFGMCAAEAMNCDQSVLKSSGIREIRCV